MFNSTFNESVGSDGTDKVSLCVISGVLAGVLSFISVSANTIVLIVLYKDPLGCFRKPIAVFIAVLALVDLITGAVVSANHVKGEVSCALGQQPSRPKNGSFASIAAIFTLNAGNYILLALSIERLVAVAYPFYYRHSASLKKTAACVTAILCYSLLFCLLQLTRLPVGIYFMVQVHLNISFPLVAVFIVNILICCILKRRRLRANSMSSEVSDTFNAAKENGRGYEREKEFAITAILIVVLFVLSLIPYYVMIQIEEYCPRCVSARWFIVFRKLSLPLLFVSAAVNPFIYSLRLSQCRRSFRIIFCCLVTSEEQSNGLTRQGTTLTDADNPSLGQADDSSQRERTDTNENLAFDTKL